MWGCTYMQIRTILPFTNAGQCTPKETRVAFKARRITQQIINDALKVFRIERRHQRQDQCGQHGVPQEHCDQVNRGQLIGRPTRKAQPNSSVLVPPTSMTLASASTFRTTRRIAVRHLLPSVRRRILG